MAWIITRDLLQEQGSEIANVGVRSTDWDDAAVEPFVTFRLRDDDCETYYHGHVDQTGLANDMAEPGGLYEAYRWGTYDSGTTDLQLRVRDAIEHGATSQDYCDKLNLRPSDWVSIYA